MALEPLDSVVTRFFRATAEERWHDAVRYLDLDAIAEIRRQAVQNAKLAPSTPPMTPERLMQMDSTMPRAVAEYQVERMRRATSERTPWPLSQFGDIRDVSVLEAMSPAAAATEWLKAVDPRTLYHKAFAGSDCPPMSVGMARELAKPNAVFSIAQRDSLAYVVYAAAFPPLGPSATDPLVAVLRQREGRWVFVPRTDLFKRMNTNFGGVSCSGPGAGRRPPGD